MQCEMIYHGNVNDIESNGSEARKIKLYGKL